jgi:putative transposase
MPRNARIVFPDVPLHIVQRGNNRARCFFSDGDYFAYLALLGQSASRFSCAVHAYCLMTNHVHLLVTPQRAGSCALMMKSVAQLYTRHINRSTGRSGRLWEGRFRSSVLDSERYVLGCYRYIELNPVRAGMVPRPGDYRWSSYQANAGGRRDTLLDPHPVYCALDRSPQQRLSAYASLFDMPLSAQTVEEFRQASRSGRKVGTPSPKRGRPKK